VTLQFMPETAPTQTSKRPISFALLLLSAYLVALAAIVIPAIAPFSETSLQVGLVAPEDIRAPQTISYQSEVLTEQQREAAERAAPTMYTAPDTSVARNQLERLRSSLAYITSVRADTFSTPEQKLVDLAALEDIRMNQELGTRLLQLNDSRWQAMQQEAVVLLEQVMRGTVREDRVEEVRRNLPAMVSLALTEEQAGIVAELVSAFIAPNSVYSESLTEAAQQQAGEAVSPVTRSYKAGEIVVQRGRVLTATDLEALQKMGLAQPQYGWRDLVAAAILVFLAILFPSLYLRRNRPLISDSRALLVIFILFMAFLITARTTVAAFDILPYVFPVAAYAMIVAGLINAETALVTLLPLGFLVSFGAANALELTLFHLITGILGLLTMGHGRRVMSFFLAGAVVAASGAATAIAFQLPLASTDLISAMTLAGAALLNGIASATITILLQYYLAQLLGTTTALQLMEISRPDHPLLQLLLRNAPGTYQHSLQVANLAEQAAERIGADALLTRVGALYHDIGKAVNPVYFIENQAPNNANPHEKLDPATSAREIIRHTIDGLELARKHRIPKRVQDFILEHHGMMIARYQYANAVKAANGDESQIDVKKFRYPGPRPRSRETAILMLADGCEARVRAERPKDEEELRTIIRNVIENRASTRQLDETHLTLQDLDALVDSFTTTLRGMYHPRIEYPKMETPENQENEPITPTRPAADLSTQPTFKGVSPDELKAK